MKKVLLLITALAVLFVISSCDNTEKAFGTLFGQDTYMEIDKSSEVPDSIYNSDLYYEYTKLSDTEKILYGKICGMIKNGETEFSFSSVTKEEVSRAYDAVLDDNPEFFWFGNGYLLYSSKDYGKYSTVKLVPKSTFPKDELESAKDLFNKKLKEITDKYNAYTDKTAAAEEIHDYLVQSITYDEEAAQLIMDKNGETYIPETNAYGAIVNLSAVCSGYAAAYQCILQKIEIPAIKLSGHSPDGESHQWNGVKLGDSWYYVDVTWDDPLGEFKNEESRLSHRYLFLDEAHFSLTHISNNKKTAPVFDSMEENYFVRKGLYFESFDRNTLTEAIKSGCDEPFIEMFFSSKAMAQDALAELKKDNLIFNLTDTDSFVYTSDESGYFKIILS